MHDLCFPHDDDRHIRKKKQAHRACSCSSVESPNGGAFPQIKALQDAVFTSTAKQSVRAGDATSIDAWRLGGKGR